MIFFMLQKTKTFLDRLVISDCLLCVFNISTIITVGIVGPTNVQLLGDCYFPVFSVMFINFCNRYIALGKS